MNHSHHGVFALPANLRAKADPHLIAADEQHFAAVRECLSLALTDLTERLQVLRRTTGRTGQQAFDRDLEVHRLAGRLGALQRLGIDLCLGHLVAAEDPEPVYVGRLGLADRSGRRLLVDWRSPAAEPFFAATHAESMGLTSRRRYRWQRGQIVDYWDEVFSLDGVDRHAALDDQSAFLASLGASRSERMRDVLSTIAADQDAIIRAPARGTLVVDGGPGTGKTVVALHRAAYLLYADPRLGHHRGGLLVVGPHQPYLAYVGDVLPSLGEEGVQVCTPQNIVAEGATAEPETDPVVARLKASARLVGAIEEAVRFYEEPPRTGTHVPTPWGDVVLSPQDWADAFDAPGPGTPHNEARDLVWDELITIVADKAYAAAPSDNNDVSDDTLRRTLMQDQDLRTTFATAWPLIDAADLVGDLWSVPAYLRRCAPWLSADEIRNLQRSDAVAWTLSDLPFLDAARQRLGDPAVTRLRNRHDAQVDARREVMSRVVDDLVSSDDSEMAVMSMLRGTDLQGVLVDAAVPTDITPDLLAGPFAHIIVDEAQELTDAEWTMLVSRCPSRSFTVVGDRAQASQGFHQTWQERLAGVGLDQVAVATLDINYRTPREVMEHAELVIRAAVPDANVPTSVRVDNHPVRHGSASDLPTVLKDWLAANAEGIGCVISTHDLADDSMVDPGRIRFLTPQLSKGLEFDLVVLVDPSSFGAGREGAVDRYVAMTRATQQLVVLTSP